MSKNFELYDYLISKIGNDISGSQNKNLISSINRLPDRLSNGNNPFEIIYVLILHYYYLEQENRRTKLNTIPYGGKFFDHGNGILYTINNLPEKLQLIIQQYIIEITEF